jgi:hypothetical protein
MALRPLLIRLKEFRFVASAGKNLERCQAVWSEQRTHFFFEVVGAGLGFATVESDLNGFVRSAE